MNKIFQLVADRMFSKDAIKFGGFKLKLHEKNPNAPLSPFYINLRDKNNPKPGPLETEDYDLIAKCLLQILSSRNKLVYKAVAPIPRAADPIIDAMARITEFQQRNIRIIKLSKKEEEGGKRQIVPCPGFEYRNGEMVLLADDLITRADTKVEAIRSIESFGSIVVGLIVLIDRQQGGRQQLESMGYTVYSAFTVSELFSYYRQTSKISQKKYHECMDYLVLR